MGILKGFRRLLVTFDVWDRFFYESLSFENHCSKIKESYFILWYFGGEFYTGKEKQRQAARTPNVVFVAASHYQNLQIVVLLLQACLSDSLALSRTLLLQQLQWLWQDRRFRLYASLFSCCLKTVLQVAWGKGRDVFSIPFPLKRRFGDLFIL